jgi:hypothetical protein
LARKAKGSSVGATWKKPLVPPWQYQNEKTPPRTSQRQKRYAQG